MCLIPKIAVILKPRTLFRFHEALKKRKYRWLFSSGGHRRPGPKGPSKELIDAIVEFKRRNPRVGCPHIAQEIARAFGIDIDKDIVRRVLANHYRPEAGTDGPSWLSLIGHMKDSLWSVDLFRCESILLRSHWIMVVMDVFTRRIIGFGVERADPCGASICRMFSQIIAGKSLPRHLSSDHDPLFRFHRWLANLRILEVEEIKSIPYVPVSHPFVDRLIGTIRREFFDHVLISGTQSTWGESWKSSEIITTKIAFTSRSVAALRENDLANRCPPTPSLTTTLGGTIAAVYSRCRLQLKLRIRHGTGSSTRLCFCWLISYPKWRVVRLSTAESRLVVF
jgi:putative transposase